MACVTEKQVKVKEEEEKEDGGGGGGGGGRVTKKTKTNRKFSGRKRKEQLKRAREMKFQKHVANDDGDAEEEKEKEEEEELERVSSVKLAKIEKDESEIRPKEEDRLTHSNSCCAGGEKMKNGPRNSNQTSAPDQLPPSSSSSSSSSSSNLLPLEQLTVDTVLSEDSSTKTLCLRGHFPLDPSLSAVVVAEKTPLSQGNVDQGVFTSATKFTTSTSNNIYSQVLAECGGSVGDVKLLTIYPATESHIVKYSKHVRHVIHETPELYDIVTRPFIQSQSFSTEWVTNILEGREEQERIIYQDPHPDTGFVLLPDFKWDQRDLQNLYLLAICQRRDVFSLRDLRSQHLPLLRNILTRGQEAVRKKYGIESDQLRVYVHYQPSYYHFHVHFTQLSYSAPKSHVGEAHLLHDIVGNIETIDADYYKKCTLSFNVSESCLLWKAYQNHLLTQSLTHSVTQSINCN